MYIYLDPYRTACVRSRELFQAFDRIESVAPLVNTANEKQGGGYAGVATNTIRRGNIKREEKNTHNNNNKKMLHPYLFLFAAQFLSRILKALKWIPYLHFKGSLHPSQPSQEYTQ
eukprot:gene647-364_t